MQSKLVSDRPPPCVSVTSSVSRPRPCFTFSLRGSHSSQRTWTLSNPPLTLSQMSPSCSAQAAEASPLIISLHYFPSAPSRPPPTLITVNKKPHLFLLRTVTQRSQRHLGRLTSSLLWPSCNPGGLAITEANTEPSWLRWRPGTLSIHNVKAVESAGAAQRTNFYTSDSS